MALYEYGGKTPHIPGPVKEGYPDGFDVAKCGSYRGYSQHGKFGVPLCEPCREARNEYHRGYYKTRGLAKPRAVGTFTPGLCGDRKGYARHQREGTTPCTECRTANTTHAAKYKTQRAARKELTDGTH